jgi:predicted nucleic acid-binding protein
VKGYLVDTNIPSELTHQQPDLRVADFIGKAGQQNLFLSVMTVGEICKGIHLLPVSQKRTGLQDWLDQIGWKSMCGRGSRAVFSPSPKPSPNAGAIWPLVDGVIAATAREHELTVVTRNVKDFTGLGVRVLNPWDAV